jgi:hypothetical protein
MVGSHLGKVVGHGDMAWEFESPTLNNKSRSVGNGKSSARDRHAILIIRAT